MKIGEKEVKEIIVTTKNGELVVTITDEDMIYDNNYVVELLHPN